MPLTDELPSIEITVNNSDMDIKFKYEEFVRPELFDEWFSYRSHRIMNSFLGTPINSNTVHAITYAIQSSLFEAVITGDLWFDTIMDQWEFDFPEKLEPNNLMKELI